MKSYFLFVVLSTFACLNAYAQCSCSGSSSSVSFGETGNSSITLKKKQWMAEIYGDYRSFGQNESAHDHSNHVHEHATDLTESSSNELKSMLIALGGIRYGLTNRITLSLQQPYILLNAKPTSTSGLGDLMLVATAKVFDTDDFSGAILAGTDLPTGVKSTLSGENNLAIGSGSFDPVVGFVLIKSWQKSFFRANVFYKRGMVGYDKTNFGSFINPSLSFSYKLKGLNALCDSDSLSLATDKFSWNVFANVAGEWYSEQKKQITVLANTGGFMLLTGVGTQLSFGKWSIPVSFTFPLVQALHGEQSHTIGRARIGITKTF